MMESTGSTKSGVGFATQFNRYKMRAYVGCQLKSVSIYLAGATTGKVFVTTNLSSSTRLAEQSFTSYDAGWTEVNFSNPWTVTQTTVYIGYELDKGPTGVIYSIVPLVNGSEYINKGDGWKTYSGKCGMFYATVTGDNVPNSDICLGTVNIPAVTSSNTPFSPTADIINMGYNKVEELEVTYQVNGEADTRTAVLKNLSIASRKSQQVTLPVITLSPDGDYNIVVSVSKVNGEADKAPVDNTSDSKLVYVRSNMPKRKILMEVFSTERCTGCPEGHALIEKTLGNKDNIVEIGHHAGFYTDPLTISASRAYEWFYKTPEYTTSYAPAVMLDRTNMRSIHGSAFAMESALFEPTATRLNKAYDTQNADAGLATIKLTTDYNKTTRHLKVTVDAEALVLLPGCTNPVLNVFLTEDNIETDRQEGTTGKYYHRHSARANLSAIWGDEIDAKTRKLTKVYETDIDAGWNVENMEIVAFVSNYDKNSNTNCKVLNAEKAAINSTPTDIIEMIPVTSSAASQIYTINGTRVTQMARDKTYIIRNADGTTRKIINNK